MDLASVADELYGLDPAEFTSRRDARALDARRAGDRQTAIAIKALKRPSLPAWIVNLTVRQRPQELGQLLDLGARLREAQLRLSGDDFRALGRERQRVVLHLTRTARTVAEAAGHPVSDSAGRQVEATLNAALTDDDAALAVASRTFGEAVGAGRNGASRSRRCHRRARP